MSAAPSSPQSVTQPVRLVDPDPASALTATFVPGAGMIGISLKDGDEELLGQRRGLGAYVGEGKTMGIPLLHPWANRLGAGAYEAAGVAVELRPGAPGLRLDPGGLPIHGLLAASPRWRAEPAVVPGGDERTELVATFDFTDPGLLASFPFPHELELAVTLRSGRLTLATTVIPASDRPVPLAYGFHPYLTLPGVPRADWVVELPAMRHRPVDERGLPTGTSAHQHHEVLDLGDRTFDDGYDEVADGALFAVSGGGRRIEVRFDHGYCAAQVFAPAADDVICFEPMAAPTNALVTGDGLRLAHPGHPATAAFSIAVLRAPASG